MQVGAMNTPYLLIITGRPGSGKTTLAQHLSEELHLPLLSRDEIKEGYARTYGLGHDNLPPDTNLIVTELFFETIATWLEAGISLIVEAAFQHTIWDLHLTPLLSHCYAHLVICRADEEEVGARLSKRLLTDPDHAYYHGDGATHPLMTYHEPNLGVPTYILETTSGYTPSLDWLIKEVFCS